MAVVLFCFVSASIAKNGAYDLVLYHQGGEFFRLQDFDMIAH